MKNDEKLKVDDCSNPAKQNKALSCPSDTFLQFNNITKSFTTGADKTEVFSGFSLGVKKGEFVSVVGSNGSGKTTLLSLLCGSSPLDSGSITAGGRDITRLAEHKRARFIGRVFQSPDMGTCPTLTVAENLSLAETKSGVFGLSPALERKKREHYKEKLSELKLGLENHLDQKAGTLSGGQRQALALLMCTLSPIEVLVLDEHTAALDPKSSETVMELTDRLVRDGSYTAIMVTHNLRHAVQYGSRLLMLHEGRAVVDVSGEAKTATGVQDLLSVFNEISIECGN